MEGPQPDLPELVPRAGARRRVQRLPDAPLAVVQVLAQGIIELAGLVYNAGSFRLVPQIG